MADDNPTLTDAPSLSAPAVATPKLPRAFCRFRALLTSAAWRDFHFAIDALPKQDIETDSDLTLKWECLSHDLSEWQLICLHDGFGQYQYGECLGTVSATPIENHVVLVLSEYTGADWQTVHSEHALPPHPTFQKRIAEGHDSLLTQAAPMIERLQARGWPMDAFFKQFTQPIEPVSDDALAVDFTTPPLTQLDITCRGKRSDAQVIARSYAERIAATTAGCQFELETISKAEWSLIAIGGRSMSALEPQNDRKAIGKFYLVRSDDGVRLTFTLTTATPHRPREWAIALPFVTGLFQELRRMSLIADDKREAEQMRVGSNVEQRNLKTFYPPFSVTLKEEIGAFAAWLQSFPNTWKSCTYTLPNEFQRPERWRKSQLSSSFDWMFEMACLDESENRIGSADCFRVEASEVESGLLVRVSFVGVEDANNLYFALIHFIGERWLSAARAAQAYGSKHAPKIAFIESPSETPSKSPLVTSTKRRRGVGGRRRADHNEEIWQLIASGMPFPDAWQAYCRKHGMNAYDLKAKEAAESAVRRRESQAQKTLKTPTK